MCALQRHLDRGVCKKRKIDSCDFSDDASRIPDLLRFHTYLYYANCQIIRCLYASTRRYRSLWRLYGSEGQDSVLTL